VYFGYTANAIGTATYAAVLHASRTIPALHINGAAAGVASATVRLSYDDGVTWTSIPVSNATGQWVATVRNPVVTSGYTGRRSGKPYAEARLPGRVSTPLARMAPSLGSGQQLTVMT
jgi:hypothetical protein